MGKILALGHSEILEVPVENLLEKSARGGRVGAGQLRETYHSRRTLRRMSRFSLHVGPSTKNEW